MIISEHEQGSDGWQQDRTGVASASKFSNIITSTGSPSSSDSIYRNTLLAEWFLNRPIESYKSDWMSRGNELEDDGAVLYGFLRDVEPQKVGFCYLDERKLIGCSPDRLINDDGLIEIKCPKESTMISYLLKGGLPTKYIQQIQGQLWITERKWCDFVAYHPEFEPIIVRVNRNERYIAILSDAVEDFVETMLKEREQLKILKAA